MDVMSRIERALTLALARGDHPGCPPKLVAAMRHAVFPRGARIRPRLCLAVAAACGEDAPAVTDAAAIAIELLHCASLVHDDLPCFDDADTRRGQPSVHTAYGEPLAVLAGDALIVLAFQSLAYGGVAHPARLGPLMLAVGASVGIPCGIVAGQAWECEEQCRPGAIPAGEDWRPVRCRHRRRGRLRRGRRRTVARGGHVAGRGVPDRRRHPGRHLQPRSPRQAGRAGRRPRPPQRRHPASAWQGAVAHLTTLSEAAVESVPPCLGRSALRSHIRTETMRLLPQDLARHAA